MASHDETREQWVRVSLLALINGARARKGGQLAPLAGVAEEASLGKPLVGGSGRHLAIDLPNAVTEV
jgi:hypothetical protein